MLKSVDALDCFAKQRELATQIQTKELEGNSMHEIGHLLLQEGHLWEAEECYLVAFENFYNATKARHSLNHTYHPSQHSNKTGGDQGHHDPENHHHESVNRTEIAWAMAGVAAGQKQWSRLAGLCRSEEAKDLRSVVQFKCGRKPLSSVGRPDYTVQDISDMERPWEGEGEEEGVSLAVSVTDEVPSASEGSWEEGFMFAGGKLGEKKRASVKKVGFGATVLEGGLEGGEPQMSVEEAMNELKELIDEAEEEKRKMDAGKSKSRASAFMEKDKRMRQSMSSEVKRRSSVAANLDRKMTEGTVESSAVDGGEK